MKKFVPIITIISIALLLAISTKTALAQTYQKKISTQEELEKLVKQQTDKRNKRRKNKKQKKSTWTGERFQDMTARYNRYFNAKLRYAEGMINLQEKNKTANADSTDLSIYTFQGGDGSEISGALDEVIKKTSIAIQRQPNSKWADDCYVLLGKAYYLMGDYDQAIQSFQYVTNEFGNSVRRVYDKRSKAKRKKLLEKAKKDKQKDKEKTKKEEREEREKARAEEEKARKDEKAERDKQREEEKKQKEQEKKDREKQREKEKKQKEKDRKEAQKDKEKERKDKQKTKEQERKDREKEKKDRLKDREKEKKDRLKEREREKKEREKEKKKRLKAKKKGKKYIPPPKKDKEAEAAKKAEEAAKRAAEKAAKEEEAARKKAETEAKKQAEAEEEKRKKEAEEAKQLEEEERKKAEEEAKQLEEEQRKAAEEEAKRLEEEQRKAEEEAELKDGDEAIIVRNKGNKGNPTYKKGGLFGFLKHKPAKHEAAIWLIRTYIDNKRFGEAETVLELAKADATFPKRLVGQLNLLEAHYHLSRSSKTKAKTALNEAVSNLRKRKDKARPYYILARLETQSRNYPAALAAYKKALRSKPDYDMAFNARLNIAKTKMLTGELNGKQAIKELEKMAKDGKNEERQDQIYFSMAEVALAEGDMKQATEYLSKSAETSKQNPTQKAQSFLRLAEINYQAERYLWASGYYDSTLLYLPKDYDGYEKIVERKDLLKDLATHVTTIQLQDSLQRIAKMPKGLRQEFVDNLIAQLEQEAEEKRLAELAEQEKDKDKEQKGGTWYFYNPTAQQRGTNEFIAKWGERPDVDNWRLNSKLTENIQATNNEGDTDFGTFTSAEELEKLAAQGRLTSEMILAQLPIGAEKMAISDSLLIEAMYAAGKIYREGLNAPLEAEDMFGQLVKRYPNNKYMAPALYNLYLIAQQQEKDGKAKQHKQTILRDHAETVYAKILQDDEYLDKLAEQERTLEKYYEETYALFQSENYDEVMSRKEKAQEMFDENPLQPKFDLLEAFVIGETTEDKTQYVSALEGIVTKYPNDEVKDKAEEILAYLKATEGKPKAKSSGKYKYNEKEQHYFVVAFDAYTQKVNKAINNISDFNQGNFSVDNLKVNQMMLDPQNQIILVKKFSNAASVMRYFKIFKTKEISILQETGVGFRAFPISKSNFTTYFKQKNAAEYQQFVEENYKP